jgi:homoserine/homoserine lactone efflux protein
MSYAMNYGYKKALPTILGQEIAVGLIVMSVGFWTKIFISFPHLFLMIKIIGAIWLFFLGTKILFSNQNHKLLSIKTKTMTWPHRCITGLLTDLTNVKTWAFMISLMPQFIEPSQILWKQVIIMTMTLITVDAIMMNIYAFTAHSMKQLMNHSKIIRIQNVIFGSILILMGCAVIFFTRY